MTVLRDDVKAYVGATETDYDALIDDCLLEATALVTKYVGASTVVEAILDRAVLEVAADLFNRRNAPNGVMNQQFATTDGAGYGAVRIARDPMAAAYKILARWVLPW